MDNCTVFNEQTVEGRSWTLTKKKLCYGCHMLITADHNATTCSNKRICKICNQKHLTGLHGFVPKRKGRNNSVTTSAAYPTENDNLGANSVLVVSNVADMDAKCASAGISAKIISMCIVPVNKIGHAGTKKEVSTLAMLDNCSQGMFIKGTFAVYQLSVTFLTWMQNLPQQESQLRSSACVLSQLIRLVMLGPKWKYQHYPC